LPLHGASSSAELAEGGSNDGVPFFFSPEENELLVHSVKSMFGVEKEGSEWFNGIKRTLRLTFPFLQDGNFRVCEESEASSKRQGEQVPSNSSEEFLIIFTLINSDGKPVRCLKHQRPFKGTVQKVPEWNSEESKLIVKCECVLYCTHQRKCPNGTSEDSVLRIQVLNRDNFYKPYDLRIGNMKSNRSKKRRKIGPENFVDTIHRWMHSWIYSLYICC